MNRTSPQLFVLLQICLALTRATSFAQGDGIYGYYDSGAFGVMDYHYQGVLFPEVYKSLASTKARYPGLWAAERNSFAAGVLPGRLSGGGWPGLYAWADVDNGPATAGGWIGGLDYGSELRAYPAEYGSVRSVDASVFSMRGAVWITPFQDNAFRGLSVTVDIDNVFESGGDGYWDNVDGKKVYVSAAALVRAGDYHLRAGIRTYNMQSGSQLETETLLDNGKLFTDGIFLGAVDGKGRTLELSVDNSYNVLYSWDRFDTLSLSLLYTQGAALSYMKHLLFIGLKAGAGISFPSVIGNHVGTFEYREYFSNLTAAGSVLRVSAAAPIVLDVRVYGPLRGALSIAPQISYAHIAQKRSQHHFKMDLPQAELSLRGTVGEKFDFAVKPTISNDTFMSALEIRYWF